MNPLFGALPDHYGILGVSEEATSDEIRTAYRQRIFKHHPDRNPVDIQAHSRAIAINIAYEVLSDDDLRSSYDELKRCAARQNSEIWSEAQERAYHQARSTYQESENAARERVKKWFYDRLGIRPTKKHRCYALQHNGTALDNLVAKISRQLGEKAWEYRISSSPDTSDRMAFRIRVVCNPRKCGFSEHHSDWVQGYYNGLFKPGTLADAEHNVRLAERWLGPILREASYSYRIDVFFGIVGSSPAPWRCYLDLSVVLVISGFDAFFHASVPSLTKFARENMMEVGTIFNELAKDRRISPVELCGSLIMRKQLARYAENVLRARRGMRTMPEFQR